MESRSRGMKSSQQHLPPRPPIMTVTFSRDTLQRRVDANKPLQVSRKPEPKFEKVGKIAEADPETDADPIHVSLVNFHRRLLGASGRSFDLVVGKLCHLLKTNGHYLDSKYTGTMDALFYSIRTLILDQEKSELSRTRLLESLELRAKTWGHDPLELPKAQPQDLPSPLKAPEVTSPQDQVVIQSQRPQQASSGRYSPIPLPPVQVAPPSPDMVALTHVAKSTPFPDDTDDDEEDEDQWMTTSDMTYESDSSEDYIIPEHEVQDLMMESTIDLDDELSRLLSAKLPDSYKRRVNDGKPVRYTRSYLLDLWKSPFSKEMPSVLRHTISHSDVSFVIQRHAFTDPAELFRQGSRDDILLMSTHLTSDPNMRSRRSSGSITLDPAATGRQDARQRTLSWPQDAGARSRLDVPGGGGEGLAQGAEGARYSGREERMDTSDSATRRGVGRNVNEQDTPGRGLEASVKPRSPDDWRRAVSASPVILGDGAGRNIGEQAPTAGGDDLSLRPQSPNDWRRSGSTSGIIGDGTGRNSGEQDIQGGQDVSLRPRSPNDWRKSGSTTGIHGSGGERVSGANISTPSPVIGGGGDSAKQSKRPGSSRGHSSSAGSHEGAMKVRFELPDGNKEAESQTDRSPLKPAPASSPVLLTPRQILGERAPDQSTIQPLLTLQSPSDVNNNGFHPDKKAEGVFDTVSSTAAQQPEVPTFREVFKEVIEKGITTRAPGPAVDLRSPSPQGSVPLSVTYRPPDAGPPGSAVDRRSPSPQGHAPLSSTYRPPEARPCQTCGHKGDTAEQSSLPESPVGGGYRAGWSAQGDWN